MGVRSACLGMPHIGANGEICDATLEFIRSGFKTKSSFSVLCAEMRKANWQAQIDAGIDQIACNEFTIFDQTLDSTVLVGNIPRRYYWEGGVVPPEIYFSMVKGQQKDKFDVHGMPSRFWFNTGYSYMVPEICEPLSFAYSDNKPIAHFLEAKKLFGISPVVTLLGPVSYMMLSDHNFGEKPTPTMNSVINKLTAVYGDLLQNLVRLNATDVRFEEPFLVKDLTREEQAAFRECYSKLRGQFGGKMKIHIATAFGSLGSNLECSMSLGADSIHYDIVNGKDDLNEVIAALPAHTSLSLGLVNANNIWVADLNAAIEVASYVCDKIGSDRLIIAPSSSLALCPLDKVLDKNAHERYAPYLSFAKNKLQEVRLITNALNNGVSSVAAELKENAALVKGLKALSDDINAKLDASLAERSKLVRKRSPFKDRRVLHAIEDKKAAILPLTDVGRGPTDHSLYSSPEIGDALKSAILDYIKLQERSLDVVNAGEIERRTNIEYFAKLIDGMESTPAKVSKVSGAAYIAKPTIYDIGVKTDEHYLDIAKHCLSVATKPLRFSLAGPVSLVNASFVPDGVDIFKLYQHFAHVVGMQIAALRKIGIKRIMIDEPNLLQHMPIRGEYAGQYIRKLSDVFKIASGYGDDDVQICLHLRGTPFAEHIENLSAFDADVLFLVAAESKFEILDAFVSYKYPNDIALGLFNADSNRVPTKAEIHSNLRKCLRVLEEHQLWVTTDTGTAGRSRKDISSIFSVMASIVQEMRKSLS